MALGKQIRKYRAKLGLTLEAPAAKCEGEIEVGTISALEVRDSQRSKYAAPIARALGLTVEQLLDETRDWITNPAPVYSLTVPAPPPIAAQYLHPRHRPLQRHAHATLERRRAGPCSQGRRHHRHHRRALGTRPHGRRVLE